MPASGAPRALPNTTYAAPQAASDNAHSAALTVGTHSGFGSDSRARSRA
jgi:hypothetical protein